MEFSVLGSGSKGNAYLVRERETLILIDTGFSSREIQKRIKKLSVDPKEISAILIRTDWNSPKDTIEKYNLIKSFYDSLNAGKSFKYLAANYSELQ
ncbi:MAG: MBL fold metallo-hydrolase, partial [Thermoanaerobaculia bacterium]